MPEYLAPGVYVEETSFRPKTIEGVSTSTAGFIGPARFGPTEGAPELLTTFSDFEQLYGGLDPLSFNDLPQPNFLAHAVRAFFQEGGKRCYAVRIYQGSGGESTGTANGVTINARYPGRAGDVRVTFTARLSENVLVEDMTQVSGSPPTGAPRLRGVRRRDVVVVTSGDSLPESGIYDVDTNENDELVLIGEDTQSVSSLNPSQDEVQRLTVDVTIERPIIRPNRPEEQFGTPETLPGFSLHPENTDSLHRYFNAENPPSRRVALTVPITMELGGSPPEDVTGRTWAAAVFGDNIANEQTVTAPLTGGSDGEAPGAAAYEGTASGTTKTGFKALEDVEDVSIVAAPGYSNDYTGDNQAQVETIQQHLINHCTKMRYRIAVLDAPNDQTVGQVRGFRGKIDSKYAALYYPWVTILNPVDGEELNLPPSGFVAGIYARNDVERGVQKAPANEVVRLALQFEQAISHGQQEVLNPEGINCFRYFEGRGYRLWGARTVTSDPEWKYVNLRRYFAYLERSIEKGTQWAVFESNGQRLWDNVRRTVSDFLVNEWKSGRLMGLTPEEAFFVRCDRSTMTQNDIDNGRLICLIGVAPLRPAEFVIFRIGQKLLETTG